MLNPLPELRRGIVLGFPLFQVAVGQTQQAVAAHALKNLFPVSV
jgi:hypothetical protein